MLRTPGDPDTTAETLPRAAGRVYPCLNRPGHVEGPPV